MTETQKEQLLAHVEHSCQNQGRYFSPEGTCMIGGLLPPSWKERYQTHLMGLVPNLDNRSITWCIRQIELNRVSVQELPQEDLAFLICKTGLSIRQLMDMQYANDVMPTIPERRDNVRRYIESVPVEPCAIQPVKLLAETCAA